MNADMLPVYEHIENNLEIYEGISHHIPPHLHKSLECVYVTEGTLELGVGINMYHMEAHDIAVIFPELIHHYQVFVPAPCQAVYLLASPSLSGGYLLTLQSFCPVLPVIKAPYVHEYIKFALNSLQKCSSKEEHTHILWQAYTQIILARALPHFHLTDKNSVGSNDIVYLTVSYVATHFAEEFTLTQMAEDLGYSPYVLSRVFFGTFHCNFNAYLNNVRLDYACNALLHTNQTITDIFENAGFTSQRTFNRVFRERFHMTPREYRNYYKYRSNTGCGH